MSGTCDTTTFIKWFICYEFDQEDNRLRKGLVKEVSFTWRPDVTWEAFDRESYLKQKRRKFEAKYGPFKAQTNSKNEVRL